MIEFDQIVKELEGLRLLLHLDELVSRDLDALPSFEGKKDQRGCEEQVESEEIPEEDPLGLVEECAHGDIRH